ncbi:MAG TPA: sulfite exporter TauE/SafE family protein [Actinomycetota bacterium]|nr:sulfite exporter TauE/SafE family protein [Actinomycetota bacterium]
MSRIARAAVLVVLAAVLLAAGAARAAAHPLGNFTVNTYSGLRVGPDRLQVDYVVDLAEIPTFQTRQAIDSDHDRAVSAAEAAGWRDRECLRLAGGLRATADGRPLALTVTGSSLTFPEGAGGLATLRLECALAASLPATRAATPTLTYADGNHPDRVGWREITAVGDRTTLQATDVPATSASARLATYPEDQLSSPLDQRTAILRFKASRAARANATSGCEAPRRGSVAEPETGCPRLSTAPGGGGADAPGGAAVTRAGADAPGGAAVTRPGIDRVTAAFTALVGERSLSPGFAVVALLLAVGLGAAHALAPGHGKTVMAAYLVGLRGTLGQAVTIGATVTVTHTAGVLVLGLVLSTSGAVASERVYPWLGLASGLLLAAVGVGLLVRARTGHHHPHPHGYGHPDHESTPGHHQHHDPGTDPARPLGRRGLVALGLAGGLVPSPSAVVVLVGGIALGQAWFGVALVVAYGLGMAATLTGTGLLLARLRDRMDRRLRLPGGSLAARLGRLVPAVSASVIVLVGVALAVNGAVQL